MKELISTRGTAHSGKAGRIDTARMVGAVNSRVSERTRDKWRGSFGWISDQQDYFLYQNDGFQHVGSGRMVEAMYAKQDSAEQVWDSLKARLDEVIRRA